MGEPVRRCTKYRLDSSIRVEERRCRGKREGSLIVVASIRGVKWIVQ